MRIGPRMLEVVAFVAEHPGRPMKAAATAAAPCRYGRIGLQYGYRTVHRALNAGLVYGRPGPRGSTLLFPKEG